MLTLKRQSVSPATLEFTNYFLRTELRMHLVTIIAFFSLAFKSTSCLSSGTDMLFWGNQVLPFQQGRCQIQASKPASQLRPSDLEGYCGSDYNPIDLKSKIHCTLQNIAAIQFVFKISSKLHTQVGQDINESVDKGLSAIFFTSQNDEGNYPTVPVAVSPHSQARVLC